MSGYCETCGNTECVCIWLASLKGPKVIEKIRFLSSGWKRMAKHYRAAWQNAALSLVDQIDMQMQFIEMRSERNSYRTTCISMLNRTKAWKACAKQYRADLYKAGEKMQWLYEEVQRYQREQVYIRQAIGNAPAETKAIIYKLCREAPGACFCGAHLSQVAMNEEHESVTS